MTARSARRDDREPRRSGRPGGPRAWIAPIGRIGSPAGGRAFPGFFNFGPLALERTGVARVAAWGRPTPERAPPAVGYRVRCGNGARLTVALAAMPPGAVVATPFMADRASVDVSPSGRSARGFGEHDVESALSLVAMVCAGDG